MTKTDGSPILITAGGLEVLRFVPSDSPVVPDDDPDTPLTWSITVTCYKAGYVFAYNHNRHQWELPGGGIEDGETPEEAARREIKEESSQIAGELSCKGLFKIRPREGAACEYAALYYTELDTLRPFVPNGETSRLTVCNHIHEYDGISAPFSRWLIKVATASTY